MPRELQPTVRRKAGYLWLARDTITGMTPVLWVWARYRLHIKLNRHESYEGKATYCALLSDFAVRTLFPSGALVIGEELAQHAPHHANYRRAC